MHHSYSLLFKSLGESIRKVRGKRRRGEGREFIGWTGRVAAPVPASPGGGRWRRGGAVRRGTSPCLRATSGYLLVAAGRSTYLGTTPSARGSSLVTSYRWSWRGRLIRKSLSPPSTLSTYCMPRLREPPAPPTLRVPTAVQTSFKCSLIFVQVVWLVWVQTSYCTSLRLSTRNVSRRYRDLSMIKTRQSGRGEACY